MTITRGRLLALNALSMVVANIIAKAILFIGMVFLLQYLNQGLESTFYLVTAFSSIMALNFQDGMVSVTIRKVATDLKNGPKYLGDLYFGSFFLAIVLVMVSFPLAFIYSRASLETPGLQGEYFKSAVFLIGAYLIGYGYSCAGAGFKAYEKLYLEAVLIILQAILNAGVYWYGANHGWVLSQFFVGLFITNFFHSILSNIVLLLMVVRPSLNFSFLDSFQLFMESLHLGYATLLRTVQDRIHPFFIDSFASHEKITQLSSPNNLLLQLKFIPLSVRPAIFPTLARKAERKSSEFQIYSVALMKFLYLIAIPLIILLIVAREEILPLVTEIAPNFKSNYSEALAIYPLVGWAVILSFPSQVLRSLFVALKKPEYEFWTVLAGVSVLAAIDILFIPSHGVIACGYASIACEAVILAYGVTLIGRAGRPLFINSLFLHATACGIVTHLIAEYAYHVHWALGVLSVIVLFPVLVLLFKVINKEEWTIVREIIKPKTRPQGF